MLSLILNKLVSVIINLITAAITDYFDQLAKDKLTKEALERAANEGNTSDIESITRSL